MAEIIPELWLFSRHVAQRETGRYSPLPRHFGSPPDRQRHHGPSGGQITPEGTRFIKFDDRRATGIAFVLGFILGAGRSSTWRWPMIGAHRVENPGRGSGRSAG
jgi:hypothetical protein